MAVSINGIGHLTSQNRPFLGTEFIQDSRFNQQLKFFDQLDTGNNVNRIYELRPEFHPQRMRKMFDIVVETLSKAPSLEIKHSANIASLRTNWAPHAYSSLSLTKNIGCLSNEDDINKVVSMNGPEREAGPNNIYHHMSHRPVIEFNNKKKLTTENIYKAQTHFRGTNTYEGRNAQGPDPSKLPGTEALNELFPCAAPFINIEGQKNILGRYSGNTRPNRP